MRHLYPQRKRHYTSPNLRRHGDSQEVIQWGFLGIAAAFWTASVLKSGPVMKPETYGTLIVQWPTQFWAGSLMLASGLFLLGIIINGRWKWSPFLRLAGATWHCFTLLAFSFGGATAEFGENLAISAGVFAVIHFWFAALNLSDLRFALRSDNAA